MSDARTLAAYDTHAARYAALDWAADSLADLEGFMAALPPGATVLDLGCGPGREAAVLAEAGFQVTAYDFSPEMVRLAAAHPGVTARQAGFDDLTGTAIYDGIWASFSLLHAPRAAFPGHLARIKRALVANGLFYLGMKLGTGEGHDNLGRFYSYYSAEELRTYLSAAGFTVTASREAMGKGLSGSVDAFVTFHCRG